MEQVESSNAGINTKILFHGVSRRRSTCACVGVQKMHNGNVEDLKVYEESVIDSVTG